MTEGRPAPDTVPAPSIPDTVHGIEHRSLLGPAVDLLHDGVPARALAQQGQGAVWSALCSTALAAVNRGWTFAEWHTELSKASSTLGRQARTKRNGQDRTDREVNRTLLRAWEKAETRFAESPPGRVSVELAARIAAVRELLADADLTDHDRAVLAVAVDTAEKNGTTTPTVPIAATAEAAGLTTWAVRTTLARLDRRGLLTCRSRGRRGDPTKGAAGGARSATYRLPTPEVAERALRRTCVPQAGHVCGADPSAPDICAEPGSPPDPPQCAGHPDRPDICAEPPHVDPAPDVPEEDDMPITITVKGRDAAAVRAQLTELLAGTDARIEETPLPARLTVLPGGRRDGQQTAAP